ncbi:MAG TPA: hypothetical protein VFP84_00440 [Kofleriaceae bacterium]|nr:hypothetical protein [Kofleriaceae bacterium]
MSIASPRVYRLASGETLTESGIPIASGFDLPRDGVLKLADGTWIEPRTFELRGADGKLRQRFGHPTSYARDDDLYVWEIYFVRDGALHGATAAFGQRSECKLSSLTVQLVELTLIGGS